MIVTIIFIIVYYFITRGRPLPLERLETPPPCSHPPPGSRAATAPPPAIVWPPSITAVAAISPHPSIACSFLCQENMGD